MVDQMQNWEDFTYSAYRRILQTAVELGYVFREFSEPVPDTRHILWRHDIDYDIEGALDLAIIEHEIGVRGTYFIWLHSPFYNAFDVASLTILDRICALGHTLGLHFDASYYGIDHRVGRASVSQKIAREAQLISELFGTSVNVMSFHNPTVSNMLAFEDTYLGGCLNAYSTVIKNEYTYGSDSNGYWRHGTLMEKVLSGAERLHILTHPVWWTHDVLAPRQKLARVMQRRSESNLAWYDAGMARDGRQNYDS